MFSIVFVYLALSLPVFSIDFICVFSIVHTHLFSIVLACMFSIVFVYLALSLPVFSIDFTCLFTITITITIIAVCKLL